MTHWRKNVLSVVVCFLAGVLIVQGVWATDYVRVDLGEIPGNYGVVILQDINNSGVAVGMVDGFSGTAVKWENGQFTDLGLGAISLATAINNNGQIVGYCASCVDSHAFMWDNGVLTNLPRLPGSTANSQVVDINDSGVAVGQAYTQNGIQHAVLWQNGQIVDVGAYFEGRSSVAKAINNNGQVVGCSFEKINGKTQYYPFIWKNGQVTELGTIADIYSLMPTGINDSGLVVGYKTIQINTYTYENWAVMWQDGQLVELGIAVGGKFPFVSVNNPGQILINGLPAVIYQNGSTTSIPNYFPIGWGQYDYDNARAINDYGQIVGGGRISDITGTKGLYLTPVCNPDLDGDGQITNADLNTALELMDGANLENWINHCWLLNTEVCDE